MHSKSYVLVLFVFSAALLNGCATSTADDAAEPRKKIALTFDDAPRGNGPVFSGDERTTRLLAALDRADIPSVAFFIRTKGLERPAGRARIERYASAGHLIANHTHTHPWLRKSDTDQYLAGVDQAESLLEGIDNRRAWFRFPYLDEGRPREQRDAVRNALKQRGLMNAYVTVDNYDWYLEQHWQRAVKAGKQVDTEALRTAYVELLMGAVRFYDDLAVEQLGRSPAHVLLLHENDVAAMFIGDLADALRNEGWEIVHPDIAYADPIALRHPATLLTGQGRVSGLAIDGGADPRTLSHYAIEEQQIDQRLERLKVFTD